MKKIIYKSVVAVSLLYPLVFAADMASADSKRSAIQVDVTSLYKFSLKNIQDGEVHLLKDPIRFSGNIKGIGRFSGNLTQALEEEKLLLSGSMDLMNKKTAYKNFFAFATFASSELRNRSVLELYFFASRRARPDVFRANKIKVVLEKTGKGFRIIRHKYKRSQETLSYEQICGTPYEKGAVCSPQFGSEEDGVQTAISRFSRRMEGFFSRRFW